MAETRTAIQVAYTQIGNDSVAKTLTDLISQAKTLQNILANLNYGGTVAGGVPPSAGGGTGGGSSLNTSLPMARTAAGGTTSAVVTGGSSTQNRAAQPSAVSQVVPPLPGTISTAFSAGPGSKASAQESVPLIRPEIEATNRLIQEQRAVSNRAANFGAGSGGGGIPLMAPEYSSANAIISESRAVRNRRANFNVARANPYSDTLLGGGLEGTLVGGTIYTPARHSASGLTSSGEAAMAEEESAATNRRRLRGRGRFAYGTMITTGMIAHNVMARYGDYWSSMYGAAPIETAGMYAGDYFQRLQSQRAATAMRLGAEMRLSWMPAQAGATGLMGFSALLGASSIQGLMAGGGAGAAGVAGATALNPLLGLGLAAGMMGGGVGLNMWSSHGQAKRQSEIDTDTARKNAAYQIAQQQQSASMQALSLMAGAIPFGRGITKTGLDYLTSAGLASGYGFAETWAMQNRFYQAGGSYNSALAAKIPGYQRFLNVTPESIGGIEKTLLAGGGTSSYTTMAGPSPLNTMPFTSEQFLARSLYYANTAGIDASRRNEWVRRQASFNSRYAEMGLSRTPTSATEIMRLHAPSGLRGLQPMAYAENVQSYGMGLAGSLNEAIMPTNVANALMMTKAISMGGGPKDWYSRLSNPNTVAAMGKGIEGSLPEMLQPFFASKITGLAPTIATLAGGGIRPSIGATSGTRLPTVPGGKTGNVAVDDTLEALKTTAEANNLYLQTWNKTIDRATKELIEIQRAIQNSERELRSITATN